MSNDAFEQADKKVHPVESQWHYPILTKYGFQPLTKEGVGFVRSYDYEHQSGKKIRCVTGSSADYWRVLPPGDEMEGYWSGLEPYLKSLNLEV